MAWEVNLANVKKYENRVEMDITLSNSEDGLSETFHFMITPKDTLKNIKAQIRNKIEQLERFKTIYDNITEGTFDVSETIIEPPSPPEPTPAEIARDEFIYDVEKYRKMKIAINYELIQPNDPDYLILIEKIKNEFKKEYISVL